MIYNSILEKIRNDYYFLKKQMVDQLFKNGSFKKRYIRGPERNFKIHSSVLKFFGNVEFFGNYDKMCVMWHAFTFMKFKYPDEKDESNIEMLAKQVYNSHKFYMKYMNKK